MDKKRRELKTEGQSPVESGVLVTLRISPASFGKLEWLSQREQRTRANMLRVLVEKAVDEAVRYTLADSTHKDAVEVHRNRGGSAHSA